MKIGELARGSGPKASAIRYYKKRGLILPPHRMGGQRRYAKEALDRVLLIRFAERHGFFTKRNQAFSGWLAGQRPGWRTLEESRPPQAQRGSGQHGTLAPSEITA